MLRICCERLVKSCLTLDIFTNFRIFTSNCSAILAIIKVPVISRTMDNHSMTEQVTALIKRLTEAERRAKLLNREIKDIRGQIAVLTASANSILRTDNASLTVGQGQIRLLSTTTTNDIQATTSKRPLDESDSSNSFVETSKRSKGNGDVPVENGYALVYTDGACENNGKTNAKAGIGVWFSPGNSLNISKPVIGRPTNNTAEIQAPTEALKVLQSLGYTKVKIFTDSRFTIDCITKWMKKWKTNNWKLASGGPVKNKEDLIKLDDMCQKFQDVKWEYCPGHSGVIGNEAADKLAQLGAKRYAGN